MTTDAPKFGSIPDWGEFAHSMAGFRIEMFRCTDNNRVRSRYVNILHVSTDLDGTRYETNRIAQFLKEMGFGIRHEQGLELRNDIDVDVVIVGSESARFEDAAYLIRRIHSVFLGLMLNWDVLWYGTNGTPRPVLPLNMRPLCSSNAFSTYGICLVHAHIRRRDDLPVWRGLFLTMLIAIEDYADRMIGTWNERSAYKKIYKFKDRVKSDGRWGSDAEMFFAAVDVMRIARNLGSHSLSNVPKEKLKKKGDGMDELLVEFDELAVKHSCPFRPPGFVTPMSPEHTHALLKWLTSISQVAVAWIAEYSKLPTRAS